MSTMSTVANPAHLKNGSVCTKFDITSMVNPNASPDDYHANGVVLTINLLGIAVQTVTSNVAYGIGDGKWHFIGECPN